MYRTPHPAGAGVHNPLPHASEHTDGTDDIQDATNAVKGLATPAQITTLEAALQGFTDVNAALAAANATIDVNGEAITGVGNLTIAGDIQLNNGEYLKGRRNTGNASVDLIGYSSGTDDVWIRGSDSIIFASTGVALMTFLASGGKLAIGTTSFPSGGASGGKILVQGDSVSAATGVAANTSVLQSIAGECWVVNDSDTATQLSPHSKRAPSTMYDNGPGVDQMRETRIPHFPGGGKIIYVAEDRRARLAELTTAEFNRLTPEQRQIVFEETFAERNARLSDSQPLEVGGWEAKEDTAEAEHAAKVQAKEDYDAAYTFYVAQRNAIAPLVAAWDQAKANFVAYQDAVKQYESAVIARDRWEQLSGKAKARVREPPEAGDAPVGVLAPVGKRPTEPVEPVNVGDPGKFTRRSDPFV